MTHYDVFNGDADGLCALHQLRLGSPRDSILVTGVKRDISLLKQVDAQPGDSICVMDISLDKNRDALIRALDNGAEVLYLDHHYPGDIPEHPSLTTHIDTHAEMCTGLIVNRLLDGAYAGWAATAAFGDNLVNSATSTASVLGLSTEQLNTLKNLGTLLNYNGYGSAMSDLHFEPNALYQRMQPYADPFDFVNNDDAYDQLNAGYRDDHSRAQRVSTHYQTDNIAIYILPDEAFARRISGVYSNELAQSNPDRAHAILSTSGASQFLVSVRAPINRRDGADELCRQFETGGGRKAAAGINCLPADQLESFIVAMERQFSR